MKAKCLRTIPESKASPNGPRVLAWACLAALLAALSSAWPQAQAPASPPIEPPQQVQLRGRVLCLAEEMHKLHEAPLATQHEHLYGFKAEDGRYYTLLRTRFSEALFADERVREKDLLLKGRVFPKTQILEVATILSVRNGVVHDLYYYCSVCAIAAVAPGPCECCREPGELVERPL
jgi:hypothetical protein